MTESVGFLLSSLGFQVSRRFFDCLAPLGLDPRQFALLGAVAAAEGQSQQALGESLRVPPSRMVALVDSLEAAGLVERRRNPADRRAHALHLTTKGRRVLARAQQRAAEHEARLCAALSPAERQALIALLRRLTFDAGLLDDVHPGLAVDAAGA